MKEARGEFRFVASGRSQHRQALKSEVRSPKSEGNPNAEGRNHDFITGSASRIGPRFVVCPPVPRKIPYPWTCPWLLRISDFGLPSDFGLRTSDFPSRAVARSKRRAIGLAICIAGFLALGTAWVLAQPTNGVYPIDLPTALQLAGAQNLDVQIARERLAEAQANRQSAVERFFPWLSAGAGYHRRDGVAQAVPAGTISDAHYQSYNPGAAVTAQMDLGDAIYRSLAAKQLVKASDHALEAQRQDTTLSAAQGYFELAKAGALVEVAREALNTSRDYKQQLHVAVGAGVVFKGDELRVQSQSEHYEIAVRQALERERVAGAELALILHLDSQVALAPRDTRLLPITLFATNAAMDSLVAQALGTRPELKQTQALLQAARAAKDGAVYGPLIPSLGAQAFGGGLGGGPDGGPSNFGAEADYFVGLTWRIGPGGLFDAGRVNASKAQLAAVKLGEAKLKDTITSQVVVSLTRVQSLSAQIALAERNLATATETLRLTRERKQYGVGIVLEDIQAQQDLTQARSDYFTTLAEYNKAQYALNKAVGGR
jgi:outer membrane protein TolC